ncbi:MAG: hypothetical protein ACTSUB_01745 [Candidatus Thorarchaeota archaeon]
MIDFPELQKQARFDIEISLETWISILQETFGSRIRYAYAKGSSVKIWDSPIDYVPEISDVDIHFRFMEYEDMIFTEDPFTQAMEISLAYEQKFQEKHPTALHLPRSQLNLLDLLMEEVEYVPPRLADVRILIGNPKQIPPPSITVIRSLDLTNLQKLEPLLKNLPMSVVDRAGHDFWTIIRRMTWQVSPSPVRLLTQKHSDPLEVWSWNRTTIVNELNNQGLNRIADAYTGFYENGWKLYLSGFKDNHAYREIVTNGYKVLRLCFEEIKVY